MTLTQLAERWNVTPLHARNIVRRDKVPFINLNHDSRSNYISYRFDEKDIIAYEEARKGVFDAER